MIFYSEGAGDMEKKVQTRLNEGIIRIDVSELVKRTELSLLPAEHACNKIYVKYVDLSMDTAELKAREMGKKSLPMASSPADLCNFYVTPSRHQAYSSFWLYGSCLIAAANGFVWFYL